MVQLAVTATGVGQTGKGVVVVDSAESLWQAVLNVLWDNRVSAAECECSVRLVHEFEVVWPPSPFVLR